MTAGPRTPTHPSGIDLGVGAACVAAIGTAIWVRDGDAATALTIMAGHALAIAVAYLVAARGRSARP